MPAKGASRGGAAGASKTTPSDAARIQSTQTKAGNDTGKNTFSARVQSAASKNNAAGSGPNSKASGTGKKA